MEIIEPMEQKNMHRCEYVSLLVEAEYVMWLAENSADGFCQGELLQAIRNYKAKRQIVVQKFNDARLSA